MAHSVIMPKTGMAMEEGVIIQWLRKEGDVVSEGDPIAEIETDKSTMELESEQGGVLLKILYEEGTTVPVTRTIAWIGEEGEDVPEEANAVADAADSASEPTPASVSEGGVQSVAAASGASPTHQDTPGPQSAVSSSGGKVRATPAARSAAEELKVPLEHVSPGGRYGEVKRNDVVGWHQNHKTTPLAARLAADMGLDRQSASAAGTGRVFSDDLENYSAAGSPSSSREDRRVPLTNIQKITGRRMIQSQFEIPAVTTDIKADVTRLLELRGELNGDSDRKYSINDFVMKAVALALRDNPRMNSSLDGDELIYRDQVNLGMAVSTERGLVVPVLTDADLRPLSSLSTAAAALAEKGRSGKLGLDEMSGGTFTVSNIGMYGVSGFTPIINQPEAGILGVCGIEEVLALKDGDVTVKKMMNLSLTFDHRIVDGAESCAFLVSVKGYLEQPLTMLV